MRAALLMELPALAEVFGLRPWDLGRLSMAELDQFRDYLAERAHRG